MLKIRLLVVALMSTILVPSSTEDTEKKDEKKQNGPARIKTLDLNVLTNVVNRYAITQVVTKMENVGESTGSETYSVVLPEAAYISRFVMEIDGENYTSHLQTKPTQTYQMEEGYSFGALGTMWESATGVANILVVKVTIKAKSKAIFYLTYEELLKRQRDCYEVAFNIRPDQVVENLHIEVNIKELRPINKESNFFRYGLFKEIDESSNIIDTKAPMELRHDTSLKVTFNLKLDDQKTLNYKVGMVGGTIGQYVVQYDVERYPLKSQVLTSDGYFVHFFAPSEVPPLNKHVVFVLDSGCRLNSDSLKLLQSYTKSILNDLKKEDTFNIITFTGGAVSTWNIIQKKPKCSSKLKEDHVDEVNVTSSFEVTDENINNAKEIIEGLKLTSLSTNANTKEALLVALDLIKKVQGANKNSNQPIILLVAHGECERFEDRTELMSQENEKTPPIYSVALGPIYMTYYLEKLALRNQGFSRAIFYGDDLTSRIKSFKGQFLSPLLSNVYFKYTSVTNLTNNNFLVWNAGTELVVAGKYEGEEIVHPIVTGNGALGPIEFQTDVKHTSDNLDRVWAYLTLQQLTNDHFPNYDHSLALEIALKYSFVTEISPLIIVKPGGEETIYTTIRHAGVSFCVFPVFPMPQPPRNPTCSKDRPSTSTSEYAGCLGPNAAEDFPEGYEDGPFPSHYPPYPGVSLPPHYPPYPGGPSPPYPDGPFPSHYPPYPGVSLPPHYPPYTGGPSPPYPVPDVPPPRYPVADVPPPRYPEVPSPPYPDVPSPPYPGVSLPPHYPPYPGGPSPPYPVPDVPFTPDYPGHGFPGKMPQDHWNWGWPLHRHHHHKFSVLRRPHTPPSGKLPDDPKSKPTTPVTNTSTP